MYFLNRLPGYEFVFNLECYHVWLQLALFVLVFDGFRLLLHFHFEEEFYKNHGKDNTEHTERVGGCVAHRHALHCCRCGFAIVLHINKGLLCGCKTGRVGNGSV